MPASHVISSSGALDSIATSATATINGIDPGPHSRVTKVQKAFGFHPGFAQMIVPLALLDDTAPSIAAVQSSPLLSIRHGMQGIVTGTQNPENDGPSVNLFVGTVTDIDADIGDDCGLVTLSDARYALDRIQLIGSFWVQLDGTIAYRQGVKAHFNKNNHPNMAWGKHDGISVPCFIEEFYGLDDVAISGNPDAVPSSPNSNVNDNNAVIATYWEPYTQILYAQFVAKQAGDLGFFDKYPYLKSLTKSLVWPDSLGSVFEISGGSTNEQRKAPERVYHCTSLLQFIHDVCKSAGPFAIDIVMSPDGTSTLAIVPTRYTGKDIPNSPSPNSGKGVSLSRPTSGEASTVLTQGGCVTTGKIGESSRNTYSMAVAVGARAMIEARFVSSRTVQNPQSATDQAASMWWGWTTGPDNGKSYSAQAKADLIKDGVNSTSTSETLAIQNMLKKYPDLFAVWFVNPMTDFQVGTTQEGMPLAKCTRPPLPHLLSSYIKAGTYDQFARINSRRPIPIEVSRVDDDTGWSVLPENDGLQIESNGYISLKAYRDTSNGALQGTTYKIVSNGHYGQSDYAITTFEPVRVRMNLAVPCDQRVAGASRMIWDASISDPEDKFPFVNGEVDDGDRIYAPADGSGLTGLYAADTGTLYASEERGGTNPGTFPSFPIPESLKDPTSTPPGQPFPATSTAQGKALYGDASVLRNDAQQAGDQALRRLQEVGRLDRGGNLKSPHIVLTEVPGMMVNDLDGFPVKAAIEGIDLDFNQQSTDRKLV